MHWSVDGLPGRWIYYGPTSITKATAKKICKYLQKKYWIDFLLEQKGTAQPVWISFRLAGALVPGISFMNEQKVRQILSNAHDFNPSYDYMEGAKIQYKGWKQTGWGNCLKYYLDDLIELQKTVKTGRGYEILTRLILKAEEELKRGKAAAEEAEALRRASQATANNDDQG